MSSSEILLVKNFLKKVFSEVIFKIVVLWCMLSYPNFLISPFMIAIR